MVHRFKARNPDPSRAAAGRTDHGRRYQSSVTWRAHSGAGADEHGFPAYEDYRGGGWGGRSGARRGHRQEAREERGPWRSSPAFDQPLSEDWGYEGDFYTGYDRTHREDRERPGSFRGRGPKNYRRSDDRILEDVCEALQEDVYVDASDIEVRVHDGEVTLSGTVETRFAKRQAEDIAESVAGVRHLQNDIRIRS
jgi:hypothetical protein